MTNFYDCSEMMRSLPAALRPYVSRAIEEQVEQIVDAKLKQCHDDIREELQELRSRLLLEFWKMIEIKTTDFGERIQVGFLLTTPQPEENE